MAIDVLKLFAGRPLAIDRGALARLAETAALQLGEAADISAARERCAAASRTQRPVTKTSAGDVAIVRLTGVIDPNPFMAWLFGGTSPDDLVQQLRAAAAAAAVVVLVVDSPGGSVDLIQETAASIRAVAAQTPIIAVARSLIASAAYWLASACSEIVASPSSQLGSIGVLAVHYDESELNARIGVKPTYIFAGDFKTELNPDGPPTPEALAYEQAQIDDIYRTFVTDVARGREVPAAKVRGDAFGKGRVMGAHAAVQAGLADRVDTLDNVIASAGAGRSRLMARANRAMADRDALDMAIAIRSRS